MMNTPRRFLALFAAALLLALPAARSAHAQAAVPPGQGDTFRDTSILKLPADATKGVAILEFEDLECPACSHAFPIVHAAVEKYQIPYIRHDFPLQMHLWSRDAAITARYLQDKVSPSIAEQYRRDVFANQSSIASKDDLGNFTRKWFGTHGQQMPFVMDPAGRFAAEVQADYTLGERVGLSHTPTIFVITQTGWIQVVDVTQLYSTIDQALAQAKNKPVVHTGVRKPATSQK
ncbi:thioredoxin domain-containing protein [Granulicella sp. WH15]|uniref:DsbA family protein n=1 Tax=Granulicella sp. WH15 TaxID=2602070 RepID=UPI0021033248|nr:thioredoxin domain-containing protein [Granulicella sp. WH15]